MAKDDFKLISTEIGIVKYNDSVYPLHLSALDNFNDMACYLGDGKHVLTTIDWFYMTNDERLTYMWHELGHLELSTVDENVADKFACQRVGFKCFETALDAGYMRTVKRLRYRREKAIFRSYLVYRINTMSNTDKDINEVFEVVFHDKFDGINGRANIEKEWALLNPDKEHERDGTETN